MKMTGSRMLLSFVLLASAFAVSAGEPAPKAKISTFALHVYEVMEKRGMPMPQAVSAFKACGVTGFDGEYIDPKLDELKAAGLKPVMIYGVMSFRDPAKDETEQNRCLSAKGVSN